jgi:6,7-dimethyl-8-ribityllumazine synthase
MRHAERGEPARLDGRDLRVGIVQARFNIELTEEIARACSAELIALGVAPSDITHITVPGALEIGAALNALADADDHDALVAIGCVIRGETYHFELVAGQAAAGLMQVQLDTGVPITFGVLTTDDKEQAFARSGPKNNKGADAAEAAIEMANLLRSIQG